MPAHDRAARRRVKAGSQRQRGVWLYVTSEELEKGGYRDGVLPERYRLWAQRGGSLFVQLYKG